MARSCAWSILSEIGRLAGKEDLEMGARCPVGHEVNIRDSVCTRCGVALTFTDRLGAATIVDLAQAFTSEELDALAEVIWNEWERLAQIRRETDVEDETYEALWDELGSIEHLMDKIQEVQDMADSLDSEQDSHEIELLSELLHNTDTPDGEKERIVAFFRERIKAIEIEQMKLMAVPRMVPLGTWIPEQPPEGFRRSIWICVKCGNGVYEKGDRDSDEWATLACANCGYDNTADLREIWRNERKRSG